MSKNQSLCCYFCRLFCANNVETRWDKVCFNRGFLQSIFNLLKYKNLVDKGSEVSASQVRTFLAIAPRNLGVAVNLIQLGNGGKRANKFS